MVPLVAGYGAGTRDIGTPNICRLVLGLPSSEPLPLRTEDIALLETNLDHLAPEAAAFAAEQLLAEGQTKDAEADELRVAAEKADADSDRFDLANVFFAVVLFVAGLTTIVQRRSIQYAFLGLSAVGLLAGFIVLATTSGAFALG